MLRQPSTKSRTEAKPQKPIQSSAGLLVSEVQVAITQRPLRVCGASPRSTSDKLTKSNVDPCRIRIAIPIKGRGLIHHESTLTHGNLRMQPCVNSNTTSSSEIPEALKVQGLGFRVQGLGDAQLHRLQHVAGHCSNKVGLLSSRIGVYIYIYKPLCKPSFHSIFYVFHVMLHYNWANIPRYPEAAALKHCSKYGSYYIVHWGSIRMMEKRMETTIMGLYSASDEYPI